MIKSSNLANKSGQKFRSKTPIARPTRQKSKNKVVKKATIVKEILAYTKSRFKSYGDQKRQMQFDLNQGMKFC